MAPPSSSKLLFLLLVVAAISGAGGTSFVFNGFGTDSLSLSDLAQITPSRALRLTNDTPQGVGHAFYPHPVPLKTASFSANTSSAFSFSTSFVFGIVPNTPGGSNGHGLAFLLSPTKDLSTGQPSQYLGLFNRTNVGRSSNHIVAVELDTVKSVDFFDIDDSHVGIDVNDLVSNMSKTAAYYDDRDGTVKNITLKSGSSMRVWIEYSGRVLKVTISPLDRVTQRPSRPLLSMPIDLSRFVEDEMFVGFSSSTGAATASHYILGWSFSAVDQAAAQELDLTKLPPLPTLPSPKRSFLVLEVALPLIGIIVLLSMIPVVMYVRKRSRRFEELIEDWEAEHASHRLPYRDLYKATGGFKEDHILGKGGFGVVYKGVMPNSKAEVAVKKIAHYSDQGVKEFVAEIASAGRLRHRSLVQLLGYCRRRDELLLVYNYMPNGSLDRFLYGTGIRSSGGAAAGTAPVLDWAKRMQVMRDVASGLLYLHEGWEQVVVHRDIKASNVLLDGELNGRLGDFGLARLYDHGSNPQTTRVVGTTGYLAPEVAKTGRATKETDVYAFGVFLLEVCCGRMPMEDEGASEAEPGVPPALLDWVLKCWKKGDLLRVADPKLGNDYEAEKMELVLQVGLLCCLPNPASRPGMAQVVQFLDGSVQFPKILPGGSMSPASWVNK